MIPYLTFAISISFISWIVGMLIHALIVKTDFYRKHLVNLCFIRNESINRYLGLDFFKWFVLHSFFKFFNPKLSMKKKIAQSELDDLRREMTTAELSHLIAFAFVLIFVVIKVVKGYYLFALVMMLVNVLMNLYPSLLQQQNKQRIDRFKQLNKQRYNRSA